MRAVAALRVCANKPQFGDHQVAVVDRADPGTDATEPQFRFRHVGPTPMLGGV